MMKCRVVYGPQGCGKTRNAGVLMERLGGLLPVQHGS